MKKTNMIVVLTVLGLGPGAIAPAAPPTPTTGPAATQPTGANPRPASPRFIRDRDGKFQFHARELDIVSVLTQLRTIEKRNLVVSNKVTGKISVDLYGVTFEEALNAVIKAGNLVARREGPFIYVMSPDEVAKQFAPDKHLTTQIFHLYYATAPEVIKLLKPLSSPEGNLVATSPSEKGIQLDSEQTGGNDYADTDTIVVVDYPENIARMQAVVARIDTRPREVLIEATILAANLSDDNSLGVDFNALVGVDFREMSAVSPGGTALRLGNVPDPQFDSATMATNTDFIAALPREGLNIGFLKNGVGVFVHALEQVTDTTVLANPKVLVLNKQRGQVLVGRRDGYRTTITTETTTIQNVEFLDTGTRLVFRPFIGNDGYVRLEIHPEDSSGGLTDAGLPFKETAEVTTNILVKDGTTVVIGGLFRERTSLRRGQIPLLGNIPLLGAGFRRTRDESLRQEIIILLTPHIIEDPAKDQHSEPLLADIETMRVGTRQGLQWYGRDKLAQAYYRSAVKHHENGQESKALWQLNAALNLQPNFLEALQLREEILDQPLRDAAGSAIKDLIHNRILSVRTPPAGKELTEVKER